MRVLEGRIADQRFAWAPSRPPDPSLLLLSLTDKSLDADQRALAGRATDFASMIDRIFNSGARALAIDLLLPSAWSQSPEFAKAVASHGDRLTLALFAAPSGELIGMEYLSPLTAYVLGPSRYQDLFGLVNLEEDEDRTIRRTRLFYLDRAGQRRWSFAQHGGSRFPGAQKRFFRREGLDRLFGAALANALDFLAGRTRPPRIDARTLSRSAGDRRGYVFRQQ